MNFGIMPEGFKRRTYLDVLTSMESKAKELFGENINLSERSPLGMFLKTIAWEESQTWEALEDSYLNIFAMDATGNALDKVVSNFGRSRYPSIYSVGQITILGDDETFIPKGFLVGTNDDILFKVANSGHIKGGTGIFDIIATYPGISSNVPAGTITKVVNPISGIKSIVNDLETRDGADIESDETLRQRHLLNLRKKVTGDNKAQYGVWARDVEGVGAVRVRRATPTPGFTTITITNANNDVPSEALLEKVFDYIDDLRPINAGVVIAPAEAIDINIITNVKAIPGVSEETIKSQLEDMVNMYFKDMILVNDYLSIAQIGKLILEIDGVLDYSELTINGSSVNIQMDDTMFPKLGSISMEVF